MYQSEFPVDTPVPIFDPTLLAGIALVVLAVAILTYSVGKHVGGRGRDDRWRDVPKTIHEAIKAKCVAATSAPSGELFYKAQDLVEEVQRRIGPVLMFGGPCAKALKGVIEALKGEPVEEKPKDKPKAGHDKKDDKTGQAHGHGDAHGVSHKPETELELAAANVTILGGQTLVLTGHRPAHEPDHGHEAPKEEEPKVLDHKDYARQVRMAVVEFSDFWSRGDCLNELERCQKVLTQTDPAARRPHERRSHDAF
ncbi:stalk cross-band protein StpD [soil metagenome]